MSQEPQADVGARVDEPAVVEFGAGEPVRKRPRASQVFTAVRKDWRLVPIIAGLSAVAVFASLIGEWQTSAFTPLQREAIPQDQLPAPATAGVAELGGFSTGYVIGVFVLVGCMALVLFGRPAMRDQLRILGLSAAGVSAALLVSVTVWLDGHSVSYASAGIYFGSQGPSFELTFGRGLTMAYLGVAGLAVALFLAGRLMPAPPAQPVATEAGAGAESRSEADAQVDWPWRRPRTAPEAEDLDGDLPPPADLTVGPTAPFVPMDGKAGMPDGKRDAPST